MQKMDKNVLYRFFSRETSIEEEKYVLDWLGESSDNQAEFNRERAFYNMTILLSEEETKPIEKQSVFIKYRWIKEIAKIAAVLLIALSIGLYYKTQTTNELLALTNTITVPAGQRVNITLPDGTKVWMNAQSELRYPAYFAGDDRRVKLSGEAYFEVTHNEQKPFIVETQSCDVEVLGTTFNVMAYPETDKFSTSLLTGKVKVTDKNNTSNQVVLTPDHEVRFSDNKFTVEPIIDYDLLRWREGLICFKNMRFTDLMEQLEKHFAVKIIIENKTVEQNILSGKLRINDGVDHALRVLQKNAHFSYNTENQNAEIIFIK